MAGEGTSENFWALLVENWEDGVKVVWHDVRLEAYIYHPQPEYVHILSLYRDLSLPSQLVKLRRHDYDE